MTSFTLTSTHGAVDTHTFAGKAAALSGTPVDGDTWTALAHRPTAAATTKATLTSTGATSTTTAATKLAGSLSGNDYFAIAKGAVVYLARQDTNHDAFAATASITPGASASQGTATTHTVTLGGPVNTNDVWTLSLAGTPLTPFTIASSSTDASAVVSDFTTKAHAATDYLAFSLRQRRLHLEDSPPVRGCRRSRSRATRMPRRRRRPAS